MARSNFDDLKGQLNSARTVAILLPADPSFDAAAAALGLEITLESLGKSVTVYCSTPPTVALHRLVGANLISTTFGNRNLVISFPGQTETVDKVSYNVENGILQLVVTPKVGTLALDFHKLTFVSGTPQPDLVIFMGNVDLDSAYANTAQYHFSANSYTEQVAFLIESLASTISPDAASNLLAGLTESTHQFQATFVSADTFDVAAFLLRHGAHRQDVAQPADFPTGSIPTTPQPVDQVAPPVIDQADKIDPDPDWYEPKIYRGTNLS